MSNQEERERLLQTEWREEIIPNLGFGQWITVYKNLKVGDSERLDMYSGLIPNHRVGESLRDKDWEINSETCRPTFQWEHGVDGQPSTPAYDRFGWSSKQVEPLVIERSFYELRPNVLEISEEFRHFHNLFCESNDSNLCRIDEVGDIIPVVQQHENQVRIRRIELRQFLAVKNMSLAVYFDRVCFSTYTMPELDLTAISETNASEDYVYRFNAWENRWTASKQYESFSRIWGKTILRGLPISKVGGSPFYDIAQKQYEEFTAGVDENDQPILFSSDPNKLANGFGSNPDAPNYLTPVFFRRSVLDKYFGEPSKFSVVDGRLYCGNLWTIPIDNNHPDFVIVFLGDLGDKLPYREQSHWKHHNVAANDGISETSWRRWFQQEGAGPQDSALQFQYNYRILVQAWFNYYGWHLFKPLAEPDTHHFRKLRRPLTNEITEFHEILLSLSILLQDRIDKKVLGKLIPDFEPKDAQNRRKGNIPVLGEFLESEGYGDTAHYVEYLRMLQVLRSNSGTVHSRNEKKYQKAVTFFSLDSKSTVQVADDIFTTLTEFLNSLREHFCPDESD